MEIIPAIDIIEGKCVRLTEGDYASKTVYATSPLDMALRYQELGFKRIHVVDLDGAKAGSVINWDVIELLAKNTNLIIDFGGGIKTEREVERVLGLGVAYVTVGSVAAKQPLLFKQWLKSYGASRFFLGADVKDRKIMTSGWINQTSIDMMDFINEYVLEGVLDLFCTDISKDGKLMGPSTLLYKEMIDRFPDIRLVASGGVSSIQDLDDLKSIGCSGVIVGKAIYEGKIDLTALATYNK